MFLDELRALPEHLVARVDPVRAQEYVRASGWVQAPATNGKAITYQRPDLDNEQIRIPLSRELKDFTPRMAEAIAYLAIQEKRPALDLLHDLLLPPADVLRFQEAGPGANTGALPFEHGLELLSAARKLLLAAACSVIRPVTFHPRTRLAEAERFVRNCLLGPVESGSVFTIACPIEIHLDTASGAPPSAGVLPSI
jgi:hypothetical protein